MGHISFCTKILTGKMKKFSQTVNTASALQPKLKDMKKVKIFVF